MPASRTWPINGRSPRPPSTLRIVRPTMRASRPSALVAQVPELVLQLLERVALVAGVAVLHLRPAGQAGPHEVAQVVERQLLDQLGDVVRLLGPGADDRQVAAQDVEHLRAARRGGCGAGAGRTRVIRGSSRCGPRRRRARRRRPHRAELEDREDAGRSCRRAPGGRAAGPGCRAGCRATTNGVDDAGARRSRRAPATTSSTRFTRR